MRKRQAVSSKGVGKQTASKRSHGTTSAVLAGA